MTEKYTQVELTAADVNAYALRDMGFDPNPLGFKLTHPHPTWFEVKFKKTQLQTIKWIRILDTQSDVDLIRYNLQILGIPAVFTEVEFTV